MCTQMGKGDMGQPFFEASISCLVMGQSPGLSLISHRLASWAVMGQSLSSPLVHYGSISLLVIGHWVILPVGL